MVLPITLYDDEGGRVIMKLDELDEAEVEVVIVLLVDEAEQLDNDIIDEIDTLERVVDDEVELDELEQTELISFDEIDEYEL